MQPWWNLATRNWRAKPARAALAVASIALGVAVVVWVTCCYESVRRKVTDVVLDWIGRAHIIVEPGLGVWGLFDERVEQIAAEVPGVSHTTTRTREYVEAASAVRDGGDPEYADYERIEMSGVLPGKEIFFRSQSVESGRYLAPGERGIVVVERILAEQFQVGLGDDLVLRDTESPNPPQRFKIVGIVDRRRASLNQPLMVWAAMEDVQAVRKIPHMVKAVDVMLHDPSPVNIRRAAAEIQGRIEARSSELRAYGDDAESGQIEVKTTEAQLAKLGAAQRLLEFIMLLLASVVLLTALFIILATMSMGVTERITELGLLRCIGVTRGQLAGIVFLQAAPLGLVGTIIGVPLGLALQSVTIRVAGEYLGAFAVHRWGLVMAILGGLGATLLGAAIPAIGVFGLSPAAATRPHSSDRAGRWCWPLAGLGLFFLSAHEILKRAMDPEALESFNLQAIAAILLLYGGVSMIAPVVVLTIGRWAAAVAAGILRLQSRLLGDEIGKAPYRSAAIASGLMVGLSLIVGLVIWGQSVKQSWQFPKEFPDALLYSYESIPIERFDDLYDLPGVKDMTVTDDFNFALKKPSKGGLFSALGGFSQFMRFLAIDPDRGLKLVRLTFLEGEEAEAKAKLKQGGHLLITREFSLQYKKHLGDRIRIWVGERDAEFTVAGVIASPGLDIAISFFNATTYFQTYAVGAIVGTLDDAERLFGRRYGRLVLLNFDLPKEDYSRIIKNRDASRVSPTMTNEQGRPTFALGPGPVPGDGPEERVVNEMLKRLGDPPKAFVTARELKQQIDDNINRVMLLLSAVPAVGLFMAALGLANLTAAGIASRSRQIAVLRALGVTQNQMLRIVIGEALVLALLGSALGVGLGVLLGRTSNFMTRLLSGFEPGLVIPWGLVLAGAGLATGLCLVAAIIPARYASRSNIVAALGDA